MKYPVIATLLASMLLSLGGDSKFNNGWKFIQQDLKGAEAVDFDDSRWRLLDLPHDWSIEGDYAEDHPMGDRGGYLPSGLGWYRKTVTVDPEWKGKHVEIAFDGVFMNSTVFANGRKLGFRPYGWISFGYDISEVVDSSDRITFAVHVDNEKQPSARWYTGSGIYADTWIRVRDKVHVVNDGIFVRTEGGNVAIDTELANTGSKRAEVALKTSVIDAEGKLVASTSKAAKLGAGESLPLNQNLVAPKPRRWSPESPVLYTLVSELERDGQLVDRVETRFGFRDVEWKPETGMWLNGKNIKLQGVCNHQDAGALGAAVPDKILRFRIEQLKAMGCNAIRTTHHPQTPQFYDICDEVGMLVMDEIFDGWKKKANNDYGAHSFDEWWKRDLSDWIRRDRNHPSVVIYSVGNETGGEIGKALVARCHELDPTRPVTSGHSASEVMDVHGVNGSSEKLGWFDHLKTDRVFIGTENTHTWQVRGYYRTRTWYRNGYPNRNQRPYETPDLTEVEVFTDDWIDGADRDNGKQVFNSSYDNAMVRLNARRNIQQLRDIPNYAGSFRWTGHDYLGEAGYVHGGWPFKSFMGGAIDTANFEKDLYYLYQSQWTEKPMIHMLPHWTHPAIELGTEIPVWVYSNCESVELFLDGVSLGIRHPGTEWDEMQCQWMVAWKPGTLNAVGYEDGKPVVEEVIRSAGAPASIKLSVDGEPLAEKGKDIVQLRVTTLDAQGEFYPYGENRTDFHVLGPARIRALDNGSPIDVEKHFEATDRIAFYGLTRGYIESTGEEGDIAVLASGILGEKKQISSKLVSIDTQVLALRGPRPELSIDVHYTTDGSEPRKTSKAYAAPFEVPLGTTVKALVLVDGKPAQMLEERFADDVGFVWKSSSKAGSLGGDQAESATIRKAVVSTEGQGFNGKGFVNLDKKGSYVEWYQENDGDAGITDLIIRYSTARKGGKPSGLELHVNGELSQKNLSLPNSKWRGLDWKEVTTEIPIGRGANRIRLTNCGNGAVSVDEIVVK